MRADLEDREVTALMGVIFLAAIVPGIFLAGSGLAMAWLKVYGGVNDVHGIFWGFLSTRTVNIVHKQKEVVYQMNNVPILYWLTIGTSYLLYQVCEGLNWFFWGFKEQLS